MNNEEIYKHLFDAVVGNPPYSSGHGNKLLYTGFFAKALELADEVAMIMPLNLNTNQTKLKAHNKLVIVHNKSISDDISDQFIGIGVGRISCVVASKHTMNEYVEVDNHSALNAIEDLFPQRVRMVSLKSTGNIQIGNIPIDPSVNVDLIHKVLKGDICVSDRMAFNEVAHKKQITNAPYVCLLNHTPSNGKFNVSIVKNDGTIAFGNWIFVIEAISEEEAICIKQHLRSDVVVKYVKRIMLALGSHTANKKIINKLPWYE